MTDYEINQARGMINKGICPRTGPFAHELVHIFDTSSILNSNKSLDNSVGIRWLDEGLADLIPTIINNGQDDEGSSLTCTETTYEYASASGEYVKLSETENPSDSSPYYKTGACFWKYIYDEFGETKFKSLMTYIGSTRYKTGTYKLFDEFKKILGKDISDIAYSRFGLKKDLTVEID